jgi:hypothetical protein
LATKQQHLHAAKCVAVTSNGFTKSAIKKAEALGVELRLLTDIPDRVIFNWAPLRTWFFNYELRAVDLSFGDDSCSRLNDELDREINLELSKKHSFDDAILQANSSTELISIRDYVVDLINSAYSGMSREKKGVFELNKELIMSFAGPATHFIQCSRGALEIIAVAFKVVFKSFTDYALSPSSAFNYADQETALVTGLQFDAMNVRTAHRTKIEVYTDVSTAVTRVSVSKVQDK